LGFYLDAFLGLERPLRQSYFVNLTSLAGPRSNFTLLPSLLKIYNMDVFPPSPAEQAGPAVAQPVDPRLQPTPDYGTLGTGCSVQSQSRSGVCDSVRKPGSSLRAYHVAAMMAGMGLAVAVSSAGGMGRIWEKFGGSRSFSENSSKNSSRSVAVSPGELDRQQPQKQAEILLERAVTRSNGTPDQIEAQIKSRVDGWRGKLTWDAQLGQLTTAALNSNDRSVRDSAVEVQLAAYGIRKEESSVDALVNQANSADHQKKIWALWSLGLLANRGIESERVVEVLSAHLKDGDRGADKVSEDARRWAVEGLALVGTSHTIAPLLAAMHDDPSPMVRERAACSLAESGMLSHEQRMIAVPQLIEYSGDSTLDAQTHGWAFQALGDITQERLPNNTAAWRSWYESHEPHN
jgi:hypothetical protein